MLLFLSSAFFPTQLMKGWYQTVAEHNPVSWMINGARDLVINGFTWRSATEALARGRGAGRGGGGVGHPPVPPAPGGGLVSSVDVPVAGRLGAPRPAGAHQGHSTAVVRGLTQRGVLGVVRVPATVVPVVIMPIIFTLAFSGAFSALTGLPGFPTSNILNWMAPFAVLQGASFAGLGASFSVGRDLENGFYDRLLLAPAPRRALVAGPLAYAQLRALIPLFTVVPIALLGGARMQGGLAGYVVLTVAALGVAVVASLWGLGVTYRLRTQRAGSLVQVGIFVVMFLSIGQVPLEAMTGWLHWVAVRNPFTYVLKMARQGFLGPVTWSTTWPGLVALAVSGAAAGLVRLAGLPHPGPLTDGRARGLVRAGPGGSARTVPHRSS